MNLKLACLMTLFTIGIVETTVAQPVKAHVANQTLTESEKNRELNKLLREGKKLVDEEKLSQALSRYQHAKTLDSENPRIFSAIGYLQAQLENFPKAIATWKKVVSLAPDNSEFYYALAYSLANNENYAEATSAYQKTVELDEDNVKAYFALSLMQIQQKNYEQAVQTINQLLQVSPNYTSAKRLKGIILLKQERFSEAESVLLEVSKSNPNNATIQLPLGITWLNLEQVSKAIDAFKKAAHLEPDRSGNIHLQIGRILETEGDVEKALEAYEEAVESKPNLVEARKAIADIFLEQKETLMAIVNHRQVLELNPNDASSYYHLGLALRDRGRIKEAITNFRQALTLYQQQNQLEAVETIKSILQNLTSSNPL